MHQMDSSSGERETVAEEENLKKDETSSDLLSLAVLVVGMVCMKYAHYIATI
jgi:hypothetical protein